MQDLRRTAGIRPGKEQSAADHLSQHTNKGAVRKQYIFRLKLHAVFMNMHVIAQ